MKLKIVFGLLFLLIFQTLTAAAQIVYVEGESRRVLTEQQRIYNQQVRERERIAIARRRMEAMNTRAQQSAAALIRGRDGVTIRYQPELTKADLAAISVRPEDLQQYKDFLNEKNTGIVRIQDAGNCEPNDLIVQAATNCPNNVRGKATGYSFRKTDYSIPVFSDLYYKSGKFLAPGVFNLGIYSKLGDVDSASLKLTADGIKPLTDFQPAAEKAEVYKEFQLLAKGVKIGDYLYKRETDAAEKSWFVLRAVAYNGKVIRDTGRGKINLLDRDSRADVTIVFRIVRKHDDGSVTLIWKQLNRLKSPNVKLEENRKKIS